MPELSLPPAQLPFSVIRNGIALVGQYITTVPLNQLPKGMALGFDRLEVSPFEDSTLSHLCPFTGVRDLGEGRCL